MSFFQSRVKPAAGAKSEERKAKQKADRECLSMPGTVQ